MGKDPVRHQPRFPPMWVALLSPTARTSNRLSASVTLGRLKRTVRWPSRMYGMRRLLISASTIRVEGKFKRLASCCFVSMLSWSVEMAALVLLVVFTTEYLSTGWWRATGLFVQTCPVVVRFALALQHPGFDILKRHSTRGHDASREEGTKAREAAGHRAAYSVDPQRSGYSFRSKGAVHSDLARHRCQRRWGQTQRAVTRHGSY